MKIIHSFRVFESLLMSGFFMIAAVFAINEPHAGLAKDFLLIFFSVFFLVLSVYAFNALCGRFYDYNNFRLMALKKVSGSMFLFGFIGFFLLAAWLAYMINPHLVLYIVAIKLLWMLYPLPKIGFKNHIFLGTILHFATQVLHFNLVYAVFSDASLTSVLLSVFFALIFAAGHLNHEVIDYEADKNVSIKTTAAVFGIRRTSLFSLLLFFTAQCYLLLLLLKGFIGLFAAIPFWLGFLIQLLIFVKSYKHFSYELEKRMYYRNTYRIIYALACIVLVAGKYLL